MAELPIGDDWQKGDEEAMSIMQNCLCPNCNGSNGTTTMLPTRVPMFREIIIMSFVCDDCAFRNSEVTFGGEIQPQGERFTLKLTSSADLDRQIIKSDSATLSIPSIELEIPPLTQQGSISTLEGMLKRAVQNLEAMQPERLRLGDVDNFHRCRGVISKLKVMVGEPVELDSDDEEEEDEGQFKPFEIILDDPAGNSFIENPHAPTPDEHLSSTKYYRTPTQDMGLGLQPSAASVEAGTIDDQNPLHKNISNVGAGKHSLDITTTSSTSIEKDLPPSFTKGGPDPDAGIGIGRREVLKFPGDCPSCGAKTETDMCVTDIPHFKEIIIMSLVCSHCGYRSNEIKGGGGIPKFGTKITLSIKCKEDFAREVLKSDTSGVAIPELELELEEGSLDGMYTTVEGLLQKLHKRLEESNPFGRGDSVTKQHMTNDPAVSPGFGQVSEQHVKFAQFLGKLKDVADGKFLPFTLVIDDPLSNSFVGPVAKDAIRLALEVEKAGGSTECYQDYVDESMVIEEYVRSQDQNDILGLSDMKTENYQQLDSVEEDGPQENYGTDQMEELPDRLRKVERRGVDHPHAVGKAPVEGDVTVMGAGSNHFAVPGLEKRGHNVPK